MVGPPFDLILIAHSYAINAFSRCSSCFLPISVHHYVDFTQADNGPFSPLHFLTSLHVFQDNHMNKKQFY